MATSSTDIVERLRNPPDIKQFRDPGKLIGDMQAEKIEAANEIERLRAALRKIRTGDWGPDEYLEDVMREALGD